MRKEIENKIKVAIEEIVKANHKTTELEKKAVELELTQANREVEKRINDFQRDLVVTDFDEINLDIYNKRKQFIDSLSEEQKKLYDEVEALATLQNKIASGMNKR